MKKKILSLTALALCFIMLFTGCSGTNKSDSEYDNSIVATIGSHKISQAEYNLIYNLVYNTFDQYYSSYNPNWFSSDIEAGRTGENLVRETTMDQLKQMYATYDLAKENKIKIDKDMKNKVAEQKEEIIAQNYSDKKGYEEFIASIYTTDKAFDNYLILCELYNSLYEKLTAKGGKAYIEDKSIEKDFLKENEDKWRVQHILISTQAETDAEGNVTKEAKSDAEALKIAKEVIKKLDKGEDFNSIIDEYDEDPGMAKDKYYLFGVGEMVEEFEEASKNLEIGEYTTEPVKTSYGYHIIKRYAIDTTIDEFQAYKNELLQTKVIEIVNERIESTKSSFDDQKIDTFFKKIQDAQAAAQAKYEKENYTVQTAEEYEAQKTEEAGKTE